MYKHTNQHIERPGDKAGPFCFRLSKERDAKQKSRYFQPMQRLLLILLVLFWQQAKAQKLVSGVVLDAEKNSPVPKASVFLNNTSIGTTANDKGEFQLQVPAGKYELIVSSVGYVTSNQTITAEEVMGFLTVKLTLKAPELETVVIEPYEKDGWQKWGRFFLENFIGTSALAEDCKILNKEVIRFRYSKAANKLTAHALEPLKIENKALGYRIQYQLETFEYNFGNKYMLYVGYPFFELMDGKAKKQNAWQQKRADVYHGSMMHFMRSVYRNTLQQEGFEVRRMKKIPNGEKARIRAMDRSSVVKNATGNLITVGLPESPDSVAYYQKVRRQPDFHDIIGRDILVGDSIAFALDTVTAALSFPDYLFVRYKNGNVPKEYIQRFPDGAHAMVSYVQLLNDEVVAIQSNGMFYNPVDLISSGYWAWSEKMATMLPFDYK